MMNSDIIQEHYVKLAKEFGASKEMSMEDNFTKESEIKDIISNLKYFCDLKNFKNVLEIGCGNGFTSEKISDTVNINYTGIDYCKELVDLAKKRDIKDYKFFVGDALNLEFPDNSFDIIFSERCLINLNSWENQKRGLSEIYRVLKKGGIYIMIECFTDGLHNLNEARKSIGLEPPINQKFFNTYFEKECFMNYINNKFEIYDEKDLGFAMIHKSNFLSTYYFGRSVLYPAFSLNRKLEYNNKFVEFFTYLEPCGNYSYIQSIVLERV